MGGRKIVHEHSVGSGEPRADGVRAGTGDGL